MKLTQRLPLLVIISGVLAQDDDAASKLCEGKSSGEMFRLQAGKKIAEMWFNAQLRVFNKSGVLQD